MKSLKTIIIAWALSVAVAMPAFASSMPASPAEFTAADTQALFARDAGSMELAMLSPEEMAATEGEWVWFAVRLAYTGYKVWRAYRRGAKIYRSANRWHKAHHNFGTRKRPNWRKHYQWNTSKGPYRVSYGRHYRYKYGRYNSYRRWWQRK
uniref:YXWGXW repeat-containing protein n=1 Tax=Candidatus Kentrum sp. TUN TaxID=2126343 RepID=A0A450ZKF6_9GAMM|nr:MAG: hypothetical protein BECKTUN1418F_GA0071002_104010 [Candidatus Kentron sp. TUN]VFK56272.1 MAG: hypothetical protein BECKTUN1418E_GA0071001_103910 [Candidatus Kentron sp. TUN]